MSLVVPEDEELLVWFRSGHSFDSKRFIVSGELAFAFTVMDLVSFFFVKLEQFEYVESSLSIVIDVLEVLK